MQTDNNATLLDLKNVFCSSTFESIYARWELIASILSALHFCRRNDLNYSDLEKKKLFSSPKIRDA